jgi:hypothetical protein
MIVCAALRYKTGYIVAGPRHFDHIMQAQISHFNTDKPEQGFIDQNGDFLDRRNAWIEAEKHGQIRNRGGWPEGTLFSENLY